MTLSEALRRFWPFCLALILTTTVGALLIESRTDTVYTASGIVRIAGPEVDPSRAATRAVNLAAAIAETSTADAREAFATADGRDDFRIIQVSESRAQVVASGADATEGVRAVLRSLADVVAAQQLAADVAADERVRPRLFIREPDGDLESLSAVESRVDGEPPEVIGTLVLEDPHDGAENALGGVGTATRLVLLSINSDAGTQALLNSLPDGVSFGIGSNDRVAPELLSVTTTGREPAEVLNAFEVVVEAVDAELQRRQEQAQVPDATRLLVDVIATPLEAREADEGMTTGARALLVIGFGIALALPAILREAISDHRPSSTVTTSDEEATARPQDVWTEDVIFPLRSPR